MIYFTALDLHDKMVTLCFVRKIYLVNQILIIEDVIYTRTKFNCNLPCINYSIMHAKEGDKNKERKRKTQYVWIRKFWFKTFRTLFHLLYFPLFLTK